MRTHLQIIDEAGGYKALAEKLTAAGHRFSAEQTRFWARRETIPPERWPAMAEAGLATIEELTIAFATKKLAEDARAVQQDAA